MRKNIKIKIDTLYNLSQLKDSEIDLANAALSIGSLDYPKVDLDSYYTHLRSIKKGLENKQTGSLGKSIEKINYVLFNIYNYRGDTENYNDPQNANIIRVIDRRLGLPVTLGVLYIHAAQSLGLSGHGLAFPGHFLVRLELNGQRAIIDPFNNGQVMRVEQLRSLLKKTMGDNLELKPSYCASLSNKDILIRILNNLKIRALNNQDIERGLTILRRMTILKPTSPDLWKELGKLESDRGNLKNAVNAFTIFVEKCCSEEERLSAIRIVNQLKKKLN